MKLISKDSILKKKMNKSDWRSVQPVSEMVRGLAELSPHAFRMLSYMYTKSDGWEFTNKAFQNELGLAERTVRKILKELIDKGYYKICRGEITVYLIGLNAVADFNKKSNQI